MLVLEISGRSGADTLCHREVSHLFHFCGISRFSRHSYSTSPRNPTNSISVFCFDSPQFTPTDSFNVDAAFTVEERGRKSSVSYVYVNIRGSERRGQRDQAKLWRKPGCFPGVCGSWRCVDMRSGFRWVWRHSPGSCWWVHVLSPHRLGLVGAGIKYSILCTCVHVWGICVVYCCVPVPSP